MKRIEAIIRPDKVADVCTALDETGHAGLTISTVEGRGSRTKWINQVRGFAYNVKSTVRARLELVVKDEDVDRITEAVRKAAYTGEEGDGKIFVHEMANAIRIRTNESGLAAL